MAKFTFLEVHLDGSEFTANAPFSSGESAESASSTLPFGSDEPDEVDDTDAESGGGPSVAPILLAVVALVLVVVVVRRVLGGSGEPVLED